MTRISIFKGAVLASILIGMVACGDGNGGSNNNGGNINPGTGTGNAQADTQSTVAQTQANTQVGIQQATSGATANLKFSAVDLQGVACTGGGTFTVVGDVTDGDPVTFNLDMNFDGCDLMDGSVSVVGSADATVPSIEYNYTIDGEVGANGCTVPFDLFSILINIPDLTNFLNGAFTVDGSVSGECSSGSTTCTYDNLEVNFSGGTTSGSVGCS